MSFSQLHGPPGLHGLGAAGHVEVVGESKHGDVYQLGESVLEVLPKQELVTLRIAVGLYSCCGQYDLFQYQR